MKDDCLEPAEIMKYSILKKIKFPIIKKFLELKKTDSLLDIGCGGGFLSERLAPFVKQVIAIDLSINNIEEAKKRSKNKNVEYKTANATKLPFKADSFDKVVASEIIEHIKDDSKFLKEIYRILKKDGICVVTTPCPNPTLSLDWLRKKAGINMAHDFGHFRPGYTYLNFRKLLHKNKLKCGGVKYYLKFFGELVRIFTYFGRNLRKIKENVDGSDLNKIKKSFAFKFYKKILYYPLYLFALLDNLLFKFKGHQIAIKIRK